MFPVLVYNLVILSLTDLAIFQVPFSYKVLPLKKNHDLFTSRFLIHELLVLLSMLRLSKIMACYDAGGYYKEYVRV